MQKLVLREEEDKVIFRGDFAEGGMDAWLRSFGPLAQILWMRLTIITIQMWSRHCGVQVNWIKEGRPRSLDLGLPKVLQEVPKNRGESKRP